MVMNLFILSVSFHSSIYFLKRLLIGYVSPENASHVLAGKPVCGFSEEIHT